MICSVMILIRKIDISFISNFMVFLLCEVPIVSDRYGDGVVTFALLVVIIWLLQ